MTMKRKARLKCRSSGLFPPMESSSFCPSTPRFCHVNANVPVHTKSKVSVQDSEAKWFLELLEVHYPGSSYFLTWRPAFLKELVACWFSNFKPGCLLVYLCIYKDKLSPFSHFMMQMAETQLFSSHVPLAFHLCFYIS